jgi:hypothetical protein
MSKNGVYNDHCHKTSVHIVRIVQYKSERNLSYIFIAYTAEQFQSTEDLRILHQIADAAARNAGVMAYWVGCSCMPEADQLQEDVRPNIPVASQSTKLIRNRCTESVM